MVLSYNELVRLVNSGVISGVHESQINGTSIDISLHNQIFREDRRGGDIVLHNDSTRRVPMSMIEENCLDEVVLAPGEVILASSQQLFYLPSDISCEVKMKSSSARGFLNHMLAGWCDPTWHGSRLTMELKNETFSHTIRIPVGTCIAQMVFFRSAEPVPAHKSYGVRGRYNNNPFTQGMK